MHAQKGQPQPALGDAAASRRRTAAFLAGRFVSPAEQSRGVLPAQAAAQARQAHAAMLSRQAGIHRAATSANLAVQWQPLGPLTVNSQSYGAITGRITSVALDPNDASGNTVWLGTTGGGVWKSTNAAGTLANVSFAPLTDTLPVYSGNTGALTIPSLSIGAVAVQPATTAVVLPERATRMRLRIPIMAKAFCGPQMVARHGLWQTSRITARMD